MDRMSRWVELVGRIRLVEWNWKTPSEIELADALGLARHPTQRGAWNHAGCEWVSLPSSAEFPEADFFLQGESWPEKGSALKGERAFRDKLDKLQGRLLPMLGMPKQSRRSRQSQNYLDLHDWEPTTGVHAQPRVTDLLDSTIWELSRFNVILTREDHVLPCNQELHLYVVAPVAMTCSGGGEDVPCAGGSGSDLQLPRAD